MIHVSTIELTHTHGFDIFDPVPAKNKTRDFLKGINSQLSIPAKKKIRLFYVEFTNDQCSSSLPLAFSSTIVSTNSQTRSTTPFETIENACFEAMQHASKKLASLSSFFSASSSSNLFATWKKYGAEVYDGYHDDNNYPHHNQTRTQLKKKH